MRNNINKYIDIILLSLIFFYPALANEQFNFDAAEIKISNDGNQVLGYGGGIVTTYEGDQIIADQFLYNKLTNILEAIGSVKFTDNLGKTNIFSDKAIYFKNDEKLLSQGNSKAINPKNSITADDLIYDKTKNIFNAKKNVEVIDHEKDTIINSENISYFKNIEKVYSSGETKVFVEKKYEFQSSDVTLLRNTSELFSKKKTLIRDNNENLYELSNFHYSIKKKNLKGKNLKIYAKVDEDKTDEYFFSEGFFNLKDKKFIAKETKIKIHKDIFDNKENDPRLYGASSRGDNIETIVGNGVFTSCKISEKRTPWCIKSKKIIHDKIKKNLVYKNAILKVYDVPILYFPKFFHPDPTVKRRTGFLQPQFNNSKTLGSSLYIPYFKTLGNDRDLTFKPTIFENDKYIFQNEFRKKNKESSLITDISLTKGYKSPTDVEKKSISHFFLDYYKNLKFTNYQDSKIEAKIQRVSNDTYLKVFQNNLFTTPVMPENKDVMESSLDLNLEKDDLIFSSGVKVYENLGVRNSDRYQFVFPYYDFNKDLLNDNIDGSINFSSSGNNKLIETNKLITTINNSLNYSSEDFISKQGFKNNFGVYLKNFNKVSKNDPIYTSSPQINGASMINFESSYPLVKIFKTNREFLTPRLSLRLNPFNNMEDHSDQSKIITADNIFTINRLGTSNSFESGKSLTLGLDYKFDPIESMSSSKEINIKDKFLEFKLATVIRDKEETNIPISSTINRKNSNLFGSINNNLLDNINIGYNFSIDNNMKTISLHSLDTEISINNFVTNFNYIEERNEIGSTHMLSNTTEYKIEDYASIKFSTRRNKSINLTEYYDLSYEYKNDCLTAALKFKKTFYQDNDLVPSEDLFFTVTLIPLTTYEREIYKRNKGWFR